MRHAKRQAMAQNAANRKTQEHHRSRPILGGAAALLLMGLLGFGGYQAMLHPDTPLPAEWNPTQQLRISDAVTPLTSWKLNRAVATAQSCLAVLDGAANLRVMDDLEVSDQCHIRGRVDLNRVGQTNLASIETRCAIALRLAMWERHSLQPAAQELLNTALVGIDHFGSYSCRAMRTAGGDGGRMSTHATGNAMDIAGFRFADGRRLRLLTDWGGTGAEAQFLRAARNGACEWFNLTLSPDYNDLHADHFHLQSEGWGLCR